MDALYRILPLASFLWPTLDCDVSIRIDPADGSHLARVFDADPPDGLAARPQASASGATPTEATEALAALLAERARPQLDALLRAAGYPTPDASTRADLAADVARLERAVADLTRECDAAQRLALATARERDQRISDLAIARGERDGLRVELDAAREEIRARASAIGALAAGHAPDFAALADRLDGCALHALRRIAERLDDQAAHRAAGEGVDLRRYVLRADVVALCDREERRCMDEWRHGAARDVARISALVSDLGGKHVEGSEQQGVEGGEGHGATVASAHGAGKSRLGGAS